MKLKPLLFSSLTVALIAGTSVNAATVLATIQGPPEVTDGNGYWSGSVCAYRWHEDYEYWDYQDCAYFDESYFETTDVAIPNLPEGTYYLESSIDAYDSNGFYAYDSEYYDDTKDYDLKTEFTIAESEVFNAGTIDFDVEFPNFQITSLNFAKQSNYIPTEGGKVTMKLKVENVTDIDQTIQIWGLHEHYEYNNYNYIYNPISKKTLTKTLAPGENLFKFFYNVPAEAPDDYSSVTVYAGTSYFSSDIDVYNASLYKGDDYYYRSGEEKVSEEGQRVKKRIPKTLDKNGKVLSYVEK